MNCLVNGFKQIKYLYVFYVMPNAFSITKIFNILSFELNSDYYILPSSES